MKERFNMERLIRGIVWLIFYFTEKLLSFLGGGVNVKFQPPTKKYRLKSDRQDPVTRRKVVPIKKGYKESKNGSLIFM